MKSLEMWQSFYVLNPPQVLLPACSAFPRRSSRRTRSSPSECRRPQRSRTWSPHCRPSTLYSWELEESSDGGNTKQYKSSGLPGKLAAYVQKSYTLRYSLLNYEQRIWHYLYVILTGIYWSGIYRGLNLLIIIVNFKVLIYDCAPEYFH